MERSQESTGLKALDRDLFSCLTASTKIINALSSVYPQYLEQRDKFNKRLLALSLAAPPLGGIAVLGLGFALQSEEAALCGGIPAIFAGPSIGLFAYAKARRSDKTTNIFDDVITGSLIKSSDLPKLENLDTLLSLWNPIRRAQGTAEQRQKIYSDLFSFPSHLIPLLVTPAIIFQESAVIPKGNKTLSVSETLAKQLVSIYKQNLDTYLSDFAAASYYFLMEGHRTGPKAKKVYLELPNDVKDKIKDISAVSRLPELNLWFDTIGKAMPEFSKPFFSS